MEEFSPLQGYNPEDEYAPVESAPEEQTAPAADTALPVQQQTAEQPEPVSPPQAEIHPGYAQPFYQPPYMPAQPPFGPDHRAQAPAQPPYQQPYAQPIQQPVYQAPVAPAPYQQPVQPGNRATYAPYPADAKPQAPGGPMPRPPYPQADPVPAQQAQPVQPYPHAPAAQPAYHSNPYAPQNSAYPAYQSPVPPKPVTPTGTKVFIIILCALLVAMVGGFIAYVAANSGSNTPSKPERNNGGYSIDNGDDDNGIYIDPFGGSDSYGSNYIDVEDEITLKEDKGDTQKRDDDNQDSVGEPDEKAKNITLQPLPKDKDDDKYTTQSAYETVSDSVVTVMCYEGKISEDESDIVSQGTGTVISADGYLITNAHVIGNSKVYAINIVMNNGNKHQAKIVGYDTWTDLAVLKIDAKDLKPVTFGDSDLINVGDEVIAIGSPGGVKFQNSLTKGIVSAVDRELSINKYVRYIQSDAAISPGNSGGPLCNIYGQVIGITTAKTIATNYENMSFSIPSDTVEEIVGDLMHYGYVTGRTRLGFSGAAISEEESFYYGTPAGVQIGAIDETGPLADTDLQEGDIIVELDGETITSFQDIYDVLANHKPDDKITVKAVRPSN